MTVESAERVRFYACDRKQRFSGVVEARQSRPGRGGATPYRCPFCSHYHLGHAPSMKTLKRIARAVRVLAQQAPA